MNKNIFTPLIHLSNDRRDIYIFHHNGELVVEINDKTGFVLQRIKQNAELPDQLIFYGGD